MIVVIIFSPFVAADQTFIIKPDYNDPLAIKITGLPPSDTELSVLKEIYNFGDGSVSTLDSPNHTYKKSGNYKVILTVMLHDIYGNLYQTTTSVRITIPFHNETKNPVRYPTSFSPLLIPSPTITPAKTLSTPVNLTIPTPRTQQTDPFYDIPYPGFSTLPVVTISQDTWNPFPSIPYLGSIYG